MKKILLVTGALALISANAMADVKRQVIASFDITPCSRTSGYYDDFNIWWPTVQFARQTTDIVVTTNHTPDLSYDRYQAANGECNGLALAAAAGIALAVNPGAFASAYETTYDGCMYARLGGEITGIGVNVESTCHW
ncbi:MAG: hypothetical protein ACXVLQ_16795 [Bacteriovorax sp.]